MITDQKLEEFEFFMKSAITKGELRATALGPSEVLELIKEIKKYRFVCIHDRLDEDGICRNCGADRRG
jgi:hypothetical protein